MRGWVIPFLLCSLFFSTTASAHCDYRLLHSAALRSTYFDVAVDGNELWAATGYGVQLLDRLSSPPRVIALIAVPGVTRAIDVRGGVVYAGSGNSVHVIRRTLAGLEIVRSLEAPGQVNDVSASAGALFVATSNGLIAFNRQDALNPSSPVTLPTSSANVLSLARDGEAQLFAADGDVTVERFSISGTPAPAGAFSALPRSLSVNVARGWIFVSDGQQTQILTLSGTATETIPYGGTTVAAHGENTFFLAGADRRFRSIDLTRLAQPVELFAADIIPTGGSVNRIGALAAADGRLYVAGGDAGLVTIDTTRFAAPFPLRSHAFGMKTSVVESESAVYVSDAFGGLTELTRFSSGALAVGRTWGGTQNHLVHSLANDLLLTSSRSTVTYWTVRSGSPAAISSANMAGPVRSAVVSGATGLVLLEDRTLWSVDLSREQPAPVKIAVPPATYIARSDRGVALVTITSEGSTEIRFYANGDFATAPVLATVEGAATAVAMSDSRVAVFTFRGITLADFGGGSAVRTLLPQSATSIVGALALQGTRLLDLSSTTLRVWDLEQGRVVNSFALPAEGLSLSTHPSAPSATVLTPEGVVTISYQNAGAQPQRLSTLRSSQYATKIVTTATRMFVFDGNTITIYSTARSAAPHYTGSVAVAGAIDLAASEDRLFVLFSNGTVTAYSHHGSVHASTRIDEGADAVFMTIFTAGGAPWVSLSRGCLSTGCEEKTLVLDPASLVRTATLDGGTKELTVADGKAYARVDVPPRKLIRAYDVAQPLHPALTAEQPADSTVAALATHRAAVLALGTRLFIHSLPSLTTSSEELPPLAVSASTDLAVDGDCAVITGRASGAELHAWSGSQWVPAGAVPLPGTARGISQQPGRIVILTDYSIEILTRVASPAPSRRRAAP